MYSEFLEDSVVTVASLLNLDVARHPVELIVPVVLAWTQLPADEACPGSRQSRCQILDPAAWQRQLVLDQQQALAAITSSVMFFSSSLKFLFWVAEVSLKKSIDQVVQKIL